MKVKVLNVKRYDFKADDGAQLRGCKVTFIDGEIGLGEKDSAGLRVETVNADYDMYGSFSALPGTYDLELGLRGKSARIRSAKLVEDKPKSAAAAA